MVTRKMMGLGLLCALVLTVSLAQGSEEPSDSDEWTEADSEFINGFFSDKVEGYTCGSVQKGSCAPRGGKCKKKWNGEYCVCKDGFHKSKCDWGPDPPHSNGFDWTPEKVKRAALALDAATASYANNTVKGEILTRFEDQCPGAPDRYDFARVVDFAHLSHEECDEACVKSSMDTQAFMGTVKASAAPTGKPEVMIAFRGTEAGQATASWQKFNDVLTDLKISRKFLYVDAGGAECPKDMRKHCTFIGYVHEGFYDALRPFIKSILMMVTAAIAEMNDIQGKFEDKVKIIAARGKDLYLPDITISGHSLGGALATLCASWVNAVFHDAHVHLYTFAAPRIGGPLFAKLLEEQDGKDGVLDIIRFVNKHDPVTMVPTSLGAGQAVMHVGPQETIDFDGIPDKCKDWFLNSQYSPFKAGIGLMTGCMDINSHTDYWNHMIPWLKSHGYTEEMMCKKGSV